MGSYYAKSLLVFSFIFLFSAPLFSQSDLDLAVKRFRAVKEGKIKSLKELEKVKVEDKLDTKVKRNKIKILPTVSIVKKVVVDKKDNLLSEDKVKGSHAVLMTCSRKKRKLGTLNLRKLSKNIMTLGDAIETAIETNYGIRIKESDVTLANISVLDADRQNFPELKYTAIDTKLNENVGMNFPGATKRIEFADDNQLKQSLELTAPIYTFGKVKFAKRAARYALLAKKEELEKNVVDLAFNVKKAFYGILLAKEMVKIQQLSLKQISKHVDTVRSQFEVGMASKFDLLRVQVQKANTEPELIKAKNQLQKAKENFNMLLGLPINRKFEIKGKLSKEKIEDCGFDKLLSIALKNRQDIKMAMKNLEAAKSSYEMNKRGKSPNLVLSSTYSRARGNVRPTEKWDESWNANLILQFPVLDKKETHVKRKQSIEKIKKAQIAVEMTKNQVSLDIKQAIHDINEARELIKASKKNIEQAEEALNIANISFENGLNTNLEVMDAYLALDKARINHLQSVYAWLIAKATLNKALGTIGNMK